MTDIICLIPARYDSTRLPGKPLLEIKGKTIIQRTYENVINSKYFNKYNTFIVTDSDKIIENIKSFNGKYKKVVEECANGTERICKVLPEIDRKYDIIVNVQGDEPFIDPKNIDKTIESYININKKDFYACSTCHYLIKDYSELNNRNVGKLVLNNGSDIIYCSRSMIPHNKNGEKLDIDYYGHIGIFVFNRNILEKCFTKENTINQLSEDIEWLKFIDYGYKIKSCIVDTTEIGINTQEDYEYLKNKYDNSTIFFHDEFKSLKKELEYQLNNFPVNKINNLANLINNHNHNIFTCGIGKCKNISNNLCDLLKSISIQCFNICPINSFHGDFGVVRKSDIIIIFSKSGNTKELINFCEFIKNKCTIIGIFCNKDNLLKDYCDNYIILPFNNEFDMSIDLIPSNSNITFSVFTNLLVKYILKYSKLSLKDYNNNHYGGNIGKQLKLVKDVMLTKIPVIELSNKENIDISFVLLEMTNYNIGCCFFTKNNNYYGLLSDGDIRRYLVKNTSNDISIDKININSKIVDNINNKVIAYKNYLKYRFLPVVVDNKILGIIHCQQYLSV